MAQVNPIGIFDSGVGGLTVFAAIRELMPRESLVYLGDTARLPYGTKSRETVIRYALEDEAFLARHQVKAIVVACNTASAVALDTLREHSTVPVVGVVEPGANAAVAASRGRCIGVIGTTGTIASNAYTDVIKRLEPRATVIAQACPLFVSLVEEGWLTDEVTWKVAQRYLTPLREAGVDTLVLACTHYPLLKPLIAEVMGQGVALVDSAEAVAEELKRMLEDHSLQTTSAHAEHHLFVTDLPGAFTHVAARFLGHHLPPVERVDLETACVFPPR
ncbi:MAG: glutamate racemase [Deltaproteobacteria bacterium]|nr:glutamate racemase [Deltaproteobacteria bacterium]